MVWTHPLCAVYVHPRDGIVLWERTMHHSALYMLHQSRVHNTMLSHLPTGTMLVRVRTVMQYRVLSCQYVLRVLLHHRTTCYEGGLDV